MTEDVEESSTAVPCAVCGYDLRNLDRSGKCPECGHEIELSLVGDRLADANPFWVQTLDYAGLLLAVGSCAAILWRLDSFWNSVVPRNPLSSRVEGWQLNLNSCLVVLRHSGVTLSCFGIWLLASPESLGQTAEGVATKPAVTLPLLRWMMLLKTSIDLVFVYFVRSQAFYAVHLASTDLSLGITAIQYPLLRGLARRSGDLFLYRITPFVMWSLIVGEFLADVPSRFSSLFGIPLHLSPEPMALLEGLYCVACGCTIALLFAYRRLLHAAAQAASQKYLAASKMA